MQRLAPIVLVVLSWSCGRPALTVDAGAPQLRAATFNVHRFFDTVCQSGQCAAGDYEALPDQASFDAKASAIVQAVRFFDADLVALEEVETQACLDALLSRLGPPWTGVLGEIGTPASVDVAVLSRTPVDSVVLHRAGTVLTRPDGSTTVFSRELPEVHTHVQGSEVIFFAAHFRSKVSDDPGRRLAEAQTTREILLGVAAANPAALVLLGGDLNDTPGSAPIDALTSDGGLLRVAADLPVEDQATYLYFGVGDALDHLLQAPTAAGHPVPLSAKVRRDVTISDHWPLLADFVLTP